MRFVANSAEDMSYYAESEREFRKDLKRWTVYNYEFKRAALHPVMNSIIPLVDDGEREFNEENGRFQMVFKADLRIFRTGTFNDLIDGLHLSEGQQDFFNRFLARLDKDYLDDLRILKNLGYGVGDG